MPGHTFLSSFQLDFVSFGCSRPGYVFEGSNNITQYAFCKDWEWVYDFDLEARCTRE